MERGFNRTAVCDSSNVRLAKNKLSFSSRYSNCGRLLLTNRHVPLRGSHFLSSCLLHGLPTPFLRVFLRMSLLFLNGDQFIIAVENFSLHLHGDIRPVNSLAPSTYSRRLIILFVILQIYKFRTQIYASYANILSYAKIQFCRQMRNTIYSTLITLIKHI